MKRESMVLMKHFADSAVSFVVSVWTEDPWSMSRRAADVHEAVWRALREAEVTIAFPQLDIHLDEPALSALERAS